MMEKQMNVPVLRFPEFEGEWETETIESSINLLSGYAFTGEEISEENSGVPLLRGINITEGTIRHNVEIDRYYLGDTSKLEKYFLKTNDLVIGMDGSKVGKNVALITEKDKNSLLIQRVARLRPTDKGDINFIYQHIVSYKFHDYVDIVNTSSGIPHISAKQIRDFKIGLPVKNEQTKIASFLTAVDKKLQALKKKKSLLEAYKKGVMQKLFSQALRFKDGDGKDFPDWEEKKLGEVADKRITKNKDNKVNLVFTNSALQGIINQRDFFDKDIANPDNITGYFLVEHNDFVYNPRISSYAPVGPISRNNLGTGIMSPLYTVFRFREGNLNYLETFFDSTIWHKHMENISNYGARDDRMSFLSADFFKMPLPFPTTHEQTKIANFMSAIDEKINQTRIAIEKTVEWKKGLLQKMFV